MTDGDWPNIHRAFETWLATENFGSVALQWVTLRARTAPHLVQVDPVQSL